MMQEQDAAPSFEQLRASFNRMFGSRRARRQHYRRFLKMHGVPKPIFSVTSERLRFNRLNEMTYMVELMEAIKAQKST
jgi:hypothetical protein